MPNYNHDYLTNIKNNLYKKNPMSGICAGLALMGVQAFLCGETEFNKFIARLDFIANHPDLFSFATDENPFEKVKNEIVEKRNKIREEIKQELANENKPTPKYIAVEANLTETEQMLLDIAAFFEGVELYLSSGAYAEQLGVYLNQNEIIEISKYTQPQLLQDLGGLIKADSFIGMYDIDELRHYMSILNKKAMNSSSNVAFKLVNNIHGIALCYNSNTRSWWFIDASNLPARIVKPDDLANLVFDAFEEKDPSARYTGFTTEILGTGKDQEKLIVFANSLKQSKKFKELHEITPKNMDRKTNDNMLLSWLAARDNDCESLSVLLRLNSKFLDEADVYIGSAPVGIAVYFNNLEFLKILVAGKTIDGIFQADLNKADNVGDTPVFFAAQKNLSECLQILVDANTVDGIFRADLNKANNEGGTPIFIATQQNSHKCLQILVDAKTADGTFRADLNKATNRGATPAFIAVINNNLKSLEILLKAKTTDGKSRIDIDKIIVDDLTLAHLAAKQGFVEILKLLDEHGANMGIENQSGKKPLDMAKSNNKLEVIAFYTALQGRKDIISHLNAHTKYSPEILQQFKEQIFAEFKRNHAQFLSENIPSLLKKLKISNETKTLFSPASNATSSHQITDSELLNKSNKPTL